ncbi:MAG: hypothetical protein K8I00_03190 [Candidatus Omnitrophica bacterium]|nr:hypothetical protein [Candidatus Omnitrophota bacterium]
MTLLYIFIFIIWSVLGIRDNVRSGYSTEVIAADLTVTAFAVAGMLVYHLNTTQAGFEHFWKGVLIAIVAWEIFLGRTDYRYMLAHPDPELSAGENKKAALMGFCIAVFLYLPCLSMIYRLAFL